MWIEEIDLATKHHALNQQEIANLFGGRIPNLLLIFGDTYSIENTDIGKKFNQAFKEAKILGCSTGTRISQNDTLEDIGISLTAIGFDSTQLRQVSENLTAHENGVSLGQSLGDKLLGANLKSVLVLCDGLNVNGSEIVDGLGLVLGPEVKISGGLAGDGEKFSKTFVMNQTETKEGLVTAIGFYGEKLIVTHGSAGGWDEFGPQRMITRSKGNVLYDMCDTNALELYENYLGEEAKALPASGLFYPLKIWHPNYPDHEMVRTLLSIDREEGSMTFAGDIPEGWYAKLMRGRSDKLILGANSAAKLAANDEIMTDNIVGPKLCLFISCVGRRLLLGERTEYEVEVVKQVLGDQTKIAGFYSYGEIATNNTSGKCGLHNQTVTLTLMGEAA